MWNFSGAPTGTMPVLTVGHLGNITCQSWQPDMDGYLATGGELQRCARAAGPHALFMPIHARAVVLSLSPPRCFSSARPPLPCLDLTSKRTLPPFLHPPCSPGRAAADS